MLIGSVIVAMGAYLGLRERAGPDAPPPAGTAMSTPTPNVTAAPDSAPARAQQPPAAPSVTPELIRASSVSASKALEQNKKHLVDKCWNAPSATKPDTQPVTYTLDLTFDAEGKQIARGISEPRGASRLGVARCIQDQLPNLTIDPPGVSVAFKVELTLP